MADGGSLKLPNAERADLGRKLEEYALNPEHREGRHKARVFEGFPRLTTCYVLRVGDERRTATA
jgi:hypothetical protein